MASLQHVEETRSWTATHLLTLSAILYFAGLAIYRLYVSPLAKFPGPKLAALTTWYNGYYDLVAGGQFVWEAERMHKKYGPVIRVRPDVLSVSDPAFIEKIYTQNPKQRRERYYTITQTLQANGSMLGSRDHDLHRQRRAQLNSYFSQQNVRRLEPMINDTLANLLYRMQQWGEHEEVVHMNVPFRAATKDIIQSYCLGESEKFLLMEDCNAQFFDIMMPQRICHLGTHVYWLAVAMASLPPWIMTALIPRVGVFTKFMQNLTVQVEEVRQAKDLPEGKTIFHEVMRSDMPESEKATRRLTDEAMVILIAGSETTASTSAAIMYHLLSDRYMLHRLKKELESAMPDSNQLPEASKLDKLPFLNAIIQEATRLYPGATHRQDRVAPDEDIYLESSAGKTFVIPAGTAVGMHPSIVNRDQRLYGDPDTFRPYRYIENPELRKYNFSFSKGGRQCLGINLAYQELQTLTAGIFRRYDVYDPARKEQSGPTLELFETTRGDVEMYADYITICARPGSKGLRVKIRN